MANDKISSLSRIYLVSEKEPESGIIGLVNCLRREPSGEKIRCVFLQGRYMDGSVTSNGVFHKIIEHDMVMNVFQNTTWGSYRHLNFENRSDRLIETDTAYIAVTTRGDLSSLKWIEGPMALKHFKPQNYLSLELCNVFYAAINFRDIMLATGKLSTEAIPGDFKTEESLLGFEFSGIDSKHRRVMGLVASCGLATKVLADPAFMWEVPKNWTLEDAATVPAVYATAYYALIVRGNMKSGESVLIHSGSGGVGQAAISIALGMNCKVFTTVGSTEKKAFLKSKFPQLQDNCFSNSRDSSFEQHVLEVTEGRGVDLILNSLSDGKLQASIRCLATEGRFLEIGKYDLFKNSNLGLAVFLKNISFHGILLDSLFQGDSHDKKLVVHEMLKGIESGIVKPIHRTVFKLDQVEESFRCMASGKHMGKVLIQIRNENEIRKQFQVKAVPRSYFNPEKSYIIIGGLGGFGLELADFLIRNGAKKLFLVSRAGITTGYQSFCIQRWKSQGVLICISTEDASNIESARNLIRNTSKCSPIGGIFNLAMVKIACKLLLLSRAVIRVC